MGVEAMRRYYKVPVLLIEFDLEKIFCLLPKVTANNNNNLSSSSSTSQQARSGQFLAGDKALNTAQNLAALNKATGNGEKVNYTGAKSSIKSIVPNEITLSALTSKLVLLTIHYPDLRIIWSRSPYATCDIFAL